ncbi:hypothetical protein MKX01_016762 [Papaver californicum]|nr:hypothetical protein MKX01_016762 [Papaver californicum]
MKQIHPIRLLSIKTINILRNTPKFILITTSIILLITIIHPLISSSSNNNISWEDLKLSGCDIYRGEWVWNPDATYYTNNTCSFIHEHQNCMKYGRPDTDFLKWRWKPNDCELPIFDPVQFLELLVGKSMAFVGDSVGRNQMQSLMCLLSKVENPVDVSTSNEWNFQRWKYSNYNFTIATFWTPFLVKSEQREGKGPTNNGLFDLYLDEYDVKWTTKIHEFDYIILSAGHWFYRPQMFYENGNLVGCFSCLRDDVKDFPMSYGYGKAFQNAFKAINSSPNFMGTTYLRTFAPSHFENGTWDSGANCVKKKPFKSSETQVDVDGLSLYNAQLKEFRVAKEEGKKTGKKFRLLDTTQAMLLRPDGHPSTYGHWPQENVTLYNDCVHWCLPGPIDSWSDFLLEMLRMDE